MSRHDLEKGYTLLEVMVALVIVAMSLGAIFQNLSQSKRTSIRADMAFKAVRLANNIFCDFEIINAVVKGETIEGSISGEENWFYKLSGEPLVLKEFSVDGAPLEIDSIKRLTLCILFNSGTGEKSFCFVKWRKS